MAQAAAATTSSNNNSGSSSSENAIVPFVLLAEFDIDEGSLLRHSYPSPTGTDTHLLAELMLPDGAHSRNEDWTIFFLNQGTVKPGTQQDNPTPNTLVVEDGGTAEKQPLLHVLNLVRTKKDDRVRRGALVKALAVCTPKPYIQIFKPLLLLALDEYFVNPSVDVLAKLSESLNALDLSLFPTLNRAERTILRFSERQDLFDDKFPEAESIKSSSSAAAASSVKQQDGSSSQDSHWTGGASSVASQHTRASTPAMPERKGSIGSFDSHMSSMEAAKMPKRPRDTHYFDARVTFNGIHLPVRVPAALEAEEVGDYSIINLIQTFSPAANPSFPPPYHPHLHSAGPVTPPVILLLNALLTCKRIVFLGTTVPAHTVAQHVLAACALGSGGGAGVLRGFIERAFPYSNLTNRDNHESVPGYIAGVANPRFEAFTQSWDVFCNIDTGKITVSKDLKIPSGAVISPNYVATSPVDEPSSPTPGSEDSDSLKSPTSNGGNTTPNTLGMGFPPAVKDKEYRESTDVVFMEEILAAVAARSGETTVRARFSDYVTRFTRLASKYEEDHLGNTTIGWPTIAFKSTPTGLGSGLVCAGDPARELQAFSPRIEAWRQSKSYQYFRQDFRTSMDKTSVPDVDLGHQVNRLRLSRNVPRGEVEGIYVTLAERLQNEEQITELLSHLPAHLGGLLPLGFGLFHPTPRVRYCAVEIFQKIESHPVGVKLLPGLSRFHQIAYARLAQELRTQSQQHQ